MTKEQTQSTMASRIKQLESEVLAYVRKEKAFDRQQKLVEYGHMKRTISLMKIIEELNREIKELKRVGKAELSVMAGSLKDRIRELSSLYDISNLKAGTNFSVDHVLQAVVDFIPPAMQYPEIACARIVFEHYDFRTKNFRDTRWKLSRPIRVNNETLGALEVCYLEAKPDLEEILFLKETEDLVAAVAESIAQIIEREWAEIEIRKGRSDLERLIKKDLP
jgi:hypothetical protein